MPTQHGFIVKIFTVSLFFIVPFLSKADDQIEPRSVDLEECVFSENVGTRPTRVTNPPDRHETQASTTVSHPTSLPVGLWPSRPTVVIVDAYSSGHLLAPAFQLQGIQTVHVHSYGAPPKASYAHTFQAGDFLLDIPHRKDLTATLKALSPFTNIVGVVVGADSGVAFGDELTEALKARFPEIPTNGIDLARKDKFLQNERLHSLGIDSAMQFKTRSIEDAVKWVREHRLLKNETDTVVVKPLMGAGTEGVYFCHTEAEIRQAMTELIGSLDSFGHLNANVLLQEFLKGTEYVVNTTSLHGRHLVTDMWSYRKRPSPSGLRPIYDYDTLLPYEGEVQKALVDYILKVLPALQIVNGNAHTEIMMVPGRGPVLVELNNRMMGASQPDLVSKALGTSQVDRTVLSFLNPLAFSKAPQGYTLHRHASVVTLANYVANGEFPDYADALVKSVPGYVSHSFNYEPGDRMKLTEDLGSSVGDIFLLCDSAEQLQKSIDTLRVLEAQGKFVRAKR